MRIADMPQYRGWKVERAAYLEFVGPNEANKSGKSDKYWEAAVLVRDRPELARTEVVLVRHWGKFGSAGETSEEDFRNRPRDARKKYEKLVSDKEAKGYRPEIDVVTRLGVIGEIG